jgi:hypothetical protein
MEGQLSANPNLEMGVVSKANSNQNDFYCIETHKELICDKVKKLLIQVCSQEEFFTVRFEVAPVGRDSQLTFHIRINNEHTF